MAKVSNRTWALLAQKGQGSIKRPKTKPPKTGEYFQAWATVYDEAHPPKPLTFSLKDLLWLR